jgi:hypothetical protein
LEVSLGDVILSDNNRRREAGEPTAREDGPKSTWLVVQLGYIQCQLYGFNKNATLTVTLHVRDSRHYDTHRVREKPILELKQLVTELYSCLHDMAENLDTIKLKLFESEFSSVPAVAIDSKSTLDSVLKDVAKTVSKFKTL